MRQFELGESVGAPWYECSSYGQVARMATSKRTESILCYVLTMLLKTPMEVDKGEGKGGKVRARTGETMTSSSGLLEKAKAKAKKGKAIRFHAVQTQDTRQEPTLINNLAYMMTGGQWNRNTRMS